MSGYRIEIRAFTEATAVSVHRLRDTWQIARRGPRSYPDEVWGTVDLRTRTTTVPRLT